MKDLSNRNLTELTLGPTKSKKPNLAHLARFTNLRRLCLAGQQKNIDVISELHFLETLYFRGITVDGLDFLRGLNHLWSLDIRLGGTNNLTALHGMVRIKHLELCQVRDLIDISVISTLTGLQYLSLESLPKIHALPDLSQLHRLRRIYLGNMKGLVDIGALESAPALEELLHTSAMGMQPEQYFELLKSKSLKALRVGFGSQRKNKLLEDLATQAGVEPCVFGEFSFV